MNLISSLIRPEITCPNLFARKFVEIAGLDPSTDTDLIAGIAATCPLGSSPLHGFRHWLTVLENGLQIIDATPDLQSNAFKGVMILFALFHDSRRQTEGHCTEHGKAGAMFLTHGVTEEQDAWIMAKFGASAVILAAYASECHTICDVPRESLLLRVGAPSPLLGRMSESEAEIIGACLDADRLDLGRVGIRPNSFYLYTKAAKEYADTH